MHHAAVPAAPAVPAAGAARKTRLGILVFLAAACATLLAMVPQTPPAGPAAKPGAKIKNVAIFLVDTLRASHLKCYGHWRDISPNIDRVASEGVLFDEAYSVSPWTRTSCASLLTGMYPCAHGVQDRDDAASDDLVTMAELFKAKGFATGGFVTNISVTQKFNLHQGFDNNILYFEKDPWFAAHPGRKNPGYVPIEGMIDDTLKFLDSVGDKPFFLYFHSTDPHYNYLPPPQFDLWSREKEAARRAAQNLPPLGADEWIEGNPYDRYDGTIRYSDEYVGRLIEHIRKQGKLDETLIVFTADHGEEWGDHAAMGHGHTLYNELLHIPLIFRHPSLVVGRRPEVVRNIDVLPTLIELCGLDGATARLQGRTLLPMLRGQPDPRPEEQFVFADVQYPSKIEGFSLEMNGWKAIYTKQNQPVKAQAVKGGKKDVWELYYTRQDRGERINLVTIEPKMLAELKSRIDQFRAKHGANAIAPLKNSVDPKVDDILNTLGYTGSGKDKDK